MTGSTVGYRVKSDDHWSRTANKYIDILTIHIHLRYSYVQWNCQSSYILLFLPKGMISPILELSPLTKTWTPSSFLVLPEFKIPWPPILPLNHLFFCPTQSWTINFLTLQLRLLIRRFPDFPLYYSHPKPKYFSLEITAVILFFKLSERTKNPSLRYVPVFHKS